MSHIAIWKYYDETMRFYFNEDGADTYVPTYVDRIQINAVPEFPTFDLRVENRGGLLEYSAGSFRVRLSLLQTETSATLGDNIKDFLFPDVKPCKFLIQVYYSDSCHFSGFFTSMDLEQALTYSQNDLYIDISVIGSLKEFADSYSQSNQGTRVQGGETIVTFENYLAYHFDTKLHWSFDLPAIDYRTRIGNSGVGFNTKLQSLVNTYGANFNNIPRWETFQELRKGLGFDLKLEFESPSVFITQRPDFKLKLFWLPDLENETPIILQTKSHDVAYINSQKPYLFIPCRYANVTYAGFGEKKDYQGIIFSETDSISISYAENEFAEAQNEPCFLYPDGTNNFSVKDNLFYKDQLGISGFESRYFPLDSVQSVDQTFYEYSQRIYEQTFNAGAMTYGFFFGDGFGANHTSVQNYLVNTYRRYLMGIKEVKTMEVVFNGNEGIDLYKPTVLNDKTFWISEINSINLQTRTATIKAIEL